MNAMRQRRALIPYLALVASLLLTTVATTAVALGARDADRARLASIMQSTVDRIRARMDAYVAVLRGATGLFAVDSAVSRADFAAYVDRLDVNRNWPGIQGVGFSLRFRTEDRERLERALRAQGATGFRTWPEPTGAEAHAIIYLEPLDRRNQAALGYDMFSEPTRRAAMIRARDGGMAALSGPVTLKQEIATPTQPGFLIYLPVYRGGEIPASVAARRERLRGFVYSPFRAHDLFGGIFGAEVDPRVGLRVYDGPRAVPDRLLYDSGADGADAPEPRAVSTLIIAGRPWTIALSPTARFDAYSRRGLVPWIATGGLLVSLLVFGFTRAQARAQLRAETSEQARGRFLAAMSHELRTPINAIIGFNDLLLAGVYGPLGREQRDGIERNQRAARQLLDLINELLDLSRIEAGRSEIVIEEVHIPALVDDVVATVRPIAEREHSPIDVECDPALAPVRTDPRRVRQILLNLLSNAIKFGSGRPVRILCRSSRHGASISVFDAGPGIAPDDLPRIFEEFVRLDGPRREGTGLGLPISRKLASALGGRLEAESTPGSGSTFRLILPRKPPHH